MILVFQKKQNKLIIIKNCELVCVWKLGRAESYLRLSEDKMEKGGRDKTKQWLKFCFTRWESSSPAVNTTHTPLCFTESLRQQFWVQYPAQGPFNTSTGGAMNQTNRLLMNRQPPYLTPEQALEWDLMVLTGQSVPMSPPPLILITYVMATSPKITPPSLLFP